MKQFVCMILCSLITTSSFSQPSCLNISTEKTTTLIFPLAIKHVDMGSRNILAQQVAGAENILLIKAASKAFEETNLSVVTADGSVYSFTVNFDAAPQLSIYHLPALTTTTESYSKGILDNGRTVHGIKDNKWGISSIVKGIYIKGNTSFYHLELNNNSSIDYDIDQLRFYIRDKKRSKRTASQETEILPFQKVGNSSRVCAHSQAVIVVALPKFTIPDAKYLAIEIMEKSGGRYLQMKVSNNKIVKAIMLPDYQ
jgi:hypothetical protein